MPCVFDCNTFTQNKIWEEDFFTVIVRNKNKEKGAKPGGTEWASETEKLKLKYIFRFI